MLNIAAKILLALLYLKGVQAVGITSNVGASCLYIANNFTTYPFDCEAPDINYACRCSDPAFLGTILVCIDDVSDTYETITQAYNYIIDVCCLQAGRTYKFKSLVDIFENATQYLIPSPDIPTYKTRSLRSPVYPHTARYNDSKRSIDSLVRHRIRATVYGAWMAGYWGVIVLIGAMNNIGIWCLPYMRMTMNGLYPRWVRRNIISPKILGRNVNRPRSTPLGRLLSFLVTIFPTRIQSLAIAGYFVLLTILLSVDYKLVMPNTVFGLECIESNIYIGDRAGIIAITQLPLIFAFTARNNLFSVITGWPYRTFNIFHRWISRFVVVLIFLHAIFYYDSARRNGDYIQRWGLTKWRFAHVGILSGFILGITSVYPFRNKFYEAFKSCHQVFSILFIVGTWYHCVTLGWMEFLYVTIGLWGLDHMIRFFKIMVSGGVVAANCELIISKRDSFGSLSSEIAVGHTIKVTINHSGYWRHYPGCYVFVYFLKPNMFWQSHPFTTIEPSVVQAANQLVLLIRVKEGVTSQLSEFLLSQPEYKAKISVLVEGPYGSPIGFRGYQNAIFVAGGIGITVVYTLALDLARQHKAEILRGDAKASDRSVTLYWITPSIESIESSVDEIAAMSEIGCLNLKIFITRQHGFSLPHNRGIPSFIDLLSTKPEKNRLGGIQSATSEMCIPSFVQESGSKDSIVLDELSPSIYANMLYGEIGSFNDTPPFTQHREEQVKAATPSGKGSSRVSHTQEFSWAGTPPLTSLKPSDKLQLYHDILLENLPRVEIKWGVKPSMKTEIVENVGKLSGTTAVVACGPDRLNCDTRDGTIKAMRDSGNERIDYFEEKLLW